MNQKNKETTIKISVETMEADEAIKKAEYLNELLEKAKSLICDLAKIESLEIKF